MMSSSRSVDEIEDPWAIDESIDMDSADGKMEKENVEEERVAEPIPPKSSTVNRRARFRGVFNLVSNRVHSVVSNRVHSAKQSLGTALEARRAGKEWDYNKKEYVSYELDQEWEAVLEEEKQMLEKNKQEQKRITASQKSVADTEYYDLLGVPFTAASPDLRKAYYKKARKYHPDKNIDGNPEQAAKNFQNLGQAYQTLKNRETRRIYDQNGKSPDSSLNSSSEDVSMQTVDPFVFFHIMFGGQLVESYIGELWIADMADAMMKQQSKEKEEEKDTDSDNEEKSDLEEKMSKDQFQFQTEESKLKQCKRQLKIARFLRDRISDYSSTGKPEDRQAFVDSCFVEATQIVSGGNNKNERQHSIFFCNFIGFAIQTAAQDYLGGIGKIKARTRMNAHAVANNLQIVKTGIKAATAVVGAAQQQQQKEEESKNNDEERKGGEERGEVTDLSDDKEEESKDDNSTTPSDQMLESIDESLPKFMKLAWAFIKRDIQLTILAAVKQKLLREGPLPLRQERAQALSILGKEFQNVAQIFKAEQTQEEITSMNEHSVEEIKACLSAAAMTTSARAQGQEITQQDQEKMIDLAKQQQQS